ncbi:MAG: lipoyl(octanoyl) transferase [Candidatus Sulfotelmatobacter sp.]
MISVVQLGTVDYATGLRLQQQLIALRKEERIGDVLLLLEHKPVITLGRNAKAKNVVASAELLKQRGVELFECDRGGDVTFHGPGQVVGYPIFDLRGFARSCRPLSSRAEENDLPNLSLESRARPEQPIAGRAPNGDLVFSARKHLGVVEFVRCLEDVLMRTCADFSIPSKRVPGLTGVWTDPESGIGHAGTAALGGPAERNSTAAAESGTHLENRHEGHEAKLAAIGVHISRSVTSHGFALNVNTDLSYFNLIVPCGIASKPVTSMQNELGRALDLNAVGESISRNFGVVFQSQMLWVDTLDALLGRTVGVPMKAPEELRRLHKKDETTWA